MNLMMIASLCVPAMAIAQTAPTSLPPPPALAEIAGRWTTNKGDLVFDVSPCDTGWCGIKVENGTCGDVALRLGAGEASTTMVQFHGRLQLAARAASLAVEANLFPRQPDQTFRLSIAGNPGKVFQFARIFPFHQIFVRSDDLSCRPNQKTS